MTMITQVEAATVATILETLRAELRAQRTTSPETGTALSAIERELQHCAEQLEITRVVSAHWPLEGKNLYERGWVLVHKVVRRYLRWYINPIVEQQNGFNAVAARALSLLIEANAELRDQLAEVRRQRDVRPPGAAPSGSLQPGPESSGSANFPSAPPGPALRPLITALAGQQMVRAHWDLDGATPFTKAKALAKQGLRQYLRWMLNPIVEQQNAANAALAGAVPHLLAADAELRANLMSCKR